MAITLRAAGAVVNSASAGSTSITLGSPTGTTSGDIVVAAFSYVGAGTNLTITPPTGWTLAKKTDSSTTQGCAIYWGTSTSSFGAWGFSISVNITGFAVGYIGVDTTTPMDVAAVGQTNASGTTITAPNITTITNNAMLVMFGAWGTTTASTLPSFTAASGGTLEQSGGLKGSARSTALGEEDAILLTAGPAQLTMTANRAAVSVGITLALRPLAPPLLRLLGLLGCGV